jgi:hypothetical protein
MESAQSLFAASEEPHPFAARRNGGVTDTLLTGTALLPAFSTVTGNADDVVPICTWPKPNAPGKAVTSPALVPEPESGIEVSPPEIFASIVSCPVRFPVWPGARLTWITQFPPAFTAVSLQLSVSLKLMLAETEVTTSAIPPVFVSVMVWTLLVVPTDCGAKVKEVG